MQSDLITQSENDAINNAAKFSTSATQALSMIPRIQRGSNRSRFNLGEAGSMVMVLAMGSVDGFPLMVVVGTPGDIVVIGTTGVVGRPLKLW